MADPLPTLSDGSPNVGGNLMLATSAYRDYYISYHIVYLKDGDIVIFPISVYLCRDNGEQSSLKILHSPMHRPRRLPHKSLDERKTNNLRV